MIFKDLFAAKIPFPPYVTTFDTFSDDNILKIAEIFEFDQAYPHYATYNDLTATNVLYFSFISTRIRDRKWRWNKGNSFTVEKRKKKKRKIAVAYTALFKPDILVLSAIDKSDLMQKANSYILKVYQQVL